MNLRRTVGALGATALLAVLTACGASSTNSAPASAGDSALTVTDVAGRTVTFDHQPERVVLGEGRGVFVTAILNHDNPFDHVVAMGSDLKTAAPSYYEKIKKENPDFTSIPTIGAIAKGDVSVENLVSYNPDVVILTKDHYDAAQGTGMTEKMDQAGLKYVVTDFRQHPLENTTKSVELYGKIFNKNDEAKKFNDNWHQVVDGVREKTANVTEKPKTFFWRAGGFAECCATNNKSNMGEFIDVAGGENIGDHLIDGESGSITPEKLIEQNPQVIIASGGSWGSDKDKQQAVPHAALGYSSDQAHARETLNGLIKTPGFDQLSAPKNDKLYGVWHQYYDSPFNYLAIQQFAQWLHPELFPQLDMEAEVKKAHEQFMPFEASGTFFVSQAEQQK